MNDSAVKKNGSAVRQFSVMLQNRAGALSGMIRLVRNAHIEVIGVSLQDSRDVTIVRMVVTDPDGLAVLFMEKGISFSVCELVVVALKESGVGMGRCLEALMAAETNVDFAYGLLARDESGCSLLALHLEDEIFGREVLGKAGFKVVYQEDLSR